MRRTFWLNYDVEPGLARCGDNKVSLRMAELNQRLAEEISTEVLDMELEIKYRYP